MNFKHYSKKLSLFGALALGVLTTSCEQNSKFGGLALYTVRDDMTKAPEAILDTVATDGYKYIEAAGYNDGKFYGLSPEDFKKDAKANGLVPLSTHQGSVNFDNVDQQIADVKAAGFEYFVIPVPPMGMFKYDNEAKKMYMEGGAKKLADILTQLGKKCDAAGLKLLYHNHNFEFSKDDDGNKIYDYLLENTDPKYVNFEMDLYWITKAGEDPVAYFEKYPGRFKLWHVKDMDDQGRFAPVGKGHIDFKRILDEKDKAGMVNYFVEQDQTFNMTPLQAIKVSHEGLKNIGFN
ncbi:sugar phosphate isomerase/epimerase family protein [Zhouia sp. PK063]|uniref:sugar phosphate isomerase/epimerase family protein n=1 Tax=Zhouia sp. PK063 TaxID=3373602 RepID=UPI0037B29407